MFLLYFGIGMLLSKTYQTNSLYCLHVSITSSNGNQYNELKANYLRVIMDQRGIIDTLKLRLTKNLCGYPSHISIEFLRHSKSYPMLLISYTNKIDRIYDLLCSRLMAKLYKMCIKVISVIHSQINRLVDCNFKSIIKTRY